MKQKIKLTVLFFGLSIVISIFFQSNNAIAQADRTLSFLPIVPHSRNINPGHIPEYKFYIGIPFLSSIKTGFENSISYEDIFLRKGDSLILDRDHILSNIDDETKINFNLMQEFISFGFKVKKNYFHFRVADLVQTNIAINKNLLTFLLYGNGSEEYLGKTVNLGGEAFNINYYREYSFGYTRQINEKLNVGGNFKYLQGIANITTNKSDFEIYTNPEDFSIKIRSHIDINMSIPGMNNSDIEIEDLLPNPKNSGFAFDLGGEYKVNEKIETFISILNIGSINWTENLKNFRTENPEKEFVYEGFDIGEYFEDNEFDTDRMENIVDSITDEFGIIETAENYTSKLAPILNVGGHYNLTKKDMFSLLVRNQFVKNSNWASASIAYTRKFSRNLNLMVSNTFFNNSYLNPGIGVAANIGPVQLYLINENFIAPFVLHNSNVFVVRFGINLIFEPKGDETLIEQPTPELE